MPNIIAFTSGLRWVQPELTHRVHHLVDDSDTRHAELAFDRGPAIGWEYRIPFRAKAQSGPDRWSFATERRGFLGMFGAAATVRISGIHTGQVDAGAFLTRGSLILSGVPVAGWRDTRLRFGKARFLSGVGEELVIFRPGSFLQRINLFVDVQPGAEKLPHLVLLIALGLYMRTLQHRLFH